MRYELTTEPENQEYNGDSLEQLSHHLEIVQSRRYVQVWIHKEDGQSLGVFCNRSFASVGWLTEDGDSATAFNPNYAGADNAVQEFYIENGQLDEYKEKDCISKQQGVHALLHFFEHGENQTGFTGVKIDSSKPTTTGPGTAPDLLHFRQRLSLVVITRGATNRR